MTNQLSVTKNTYSTIDIAKFLFCICIICLHSNGLATIMSDDTYYYFQKFLLRFAVPFFFVVSAFFLGKKLKAVDVEEYKTIVFKYCKRLLLPLLVFETINIVERVIEDIWEGRSVLNIILLELRRILFYPSGALWFIQGCIVAALMLLPFLKRKKLNLAIIIGLLLYCFALLADSYYWLIEGSVLQRIIDKYLLVFVSIRNGVFLGFILMAIGVKCAEENFESLNKGSLIVGSLFGRLSENSDIAI